MKLQDIVLYTTFRQNVKCVFPGTEKLIITHVTLQLQHPATE